jgi:predicted DCC family thiol-disulfide oxidoreductase YuxK
VFDGDCGFCTTSVGWLEARFPAAFGSVPYQRAPLASYGLTARECRDRLQWLAWPEDPHDRGREQGSRAVGAVLRAGGRRRGGLVGAGWAALGTLAFAPPTSWVAAGVYAWVAANRYRLPGGTPACAI